jgi:hypothetical protein
MTMGYYSDTVGTNDIISSYVLIWRSCFFSCSPDMSSLLFLISGLIEFSSGVLGLLTNSLGLFPELRILFASDLDGDSRMAVELFCYGKFF